MRPAIIFSLVAAAGASVAISSVAAAVTNVTASPAVSSAALDMPKQALFRQLTEHVMLPLAHDFASAANRLVATTRTACTVEGLPQMQAAWRQIHSAWQPLEVVQLGPAVELRTQRQINAWPFRPRLLKPLMASEGPVDQARVDSLGVSGKGLPALEYLLFPAKEAGEASTEFATPQCGLIQALAVQVAAEADALALAWSEPDGGFARQLIEAGQHPEQGVFSTPDQALSDMVNLMIAGLDAVKTRKLVKALEKSADTAALERIESWRSQTSLHHIRDNLRGLELGFFGAGPEKIGLDDYVIGLERPNLVRLMRKELDEAMQALAAIELPLQRAVLEETQKVAALAKAIEQLQRRLESDIADALKVDLGFNTSDGD
jgi:predicted lipoprotein